MTFFIYFLEGSAKSFWKHENLLLTVYQQEIRMTIRKSHWSIITKMRRFIVTASISKFPSMILTVHMILQPIVTTDRHFH